MSKEKQVKENTGEWLKNVFSEYKDASEAALKIASECWTAVALNIKKDISFFMNSVCYSWFWNRFEAVGTLYECNQIQRKDGHGMCLILQHSKLTSGVPVCEVVYRGKNQCTREELKLLAKFPLGSYPCRVQFAGHCKTHNGGHTMILPCIEMNDCQDMNIYDRILVFKARLFFVMHTAELKMIPRPTLPIVQLDAIDEQDIREAAENCTG